MRAGVLALGLAGCVSIPPFHGDSAGSDASPSPLAVRSIGNAYVDSNGVGSPGMTTTSYAIATTGIANGDLVFLVGNIDNGAENFWKLPDGFQALANGHNGNDGQSYVVAWKIAANEPAVYMNGYGPSSTSGAATVSLLAVTGYDPQLPINVSLPWAYPDDADPANISSPGVTTTVDNTLLLYAAGVDWHGESGTNTYTPPDGFTTVTTLGDRVTRWQWTSQIIASKPQAVAGPTGPLDATTAGIGNPDTTRHIPGAGWTVTVAIAPAR